MMISPSGMANRTSLPSTAMQVVDDEVGLVVTLEVVGFGGSHADAGGTATDDVDVSIAVGQVGDLHAVAGQALPDSRHSAETVARVFLNVSVPSLSFRFGGISHLFYTPLHKKASTIFALS